MCELRGLKCDDDECILTMVKTLVYQLSAVESVQCNGRLPLYNKVDDQGSARVKSRRMALLRTIIIR